LNPRHVRDTPLSKLPLPLQLEIKFHANNILLLGLRHWFTGEDPKDKRSTIEKVQEDSVKLGETALKAVASGAIAVLNQLESVRHELLF